MQDPPSADASSETNAAGRPRGRPDWIIGLGGLVLAVGTIVSGDTHFDVIMLTGGPVSIPESLGLFQLESALTGLGNLLAAVGFLAVFIGIAIALRRPSSGPRRMSPRAFAALIGGGLLVAAGLVAASLVAFSTYPPSLLNFPSYNAVDLAGRVLEAAGFLVGFAGVAAALRL